MTGAIIASRSRRVETVDDPVDTQHCIKTADAFAACRQKRQSGRYVVASQEWPDISGHSLRRAVSMTVLIYRPLSHLAREWLDGPLS